MSISRYQKTSVGPSQRVDSREGRNMDKRRTVTNVERNHSNLEHAGALNGENQD